MIRLPALLLLSLTAAPAAAQWSLYYRGYSDADLRGATDTVESRSMGGSWRWRDTSADPRGAWTLLYQHDPLLVRSGEPASNGYFHRLGLAGAWRIGNSTLQLTPALQASSNMFKHLHLRAEALVLETAWWQSRPLSTDSIWQWGLAADHRFGRYRPYPLLGYSGSLAGGELQILLPQRLAFNAPGGSWTVALTKTGRRWATLDSSRTVEGSTRYDDWQFGVEHRLNAPAALEWTLEVGIAFQRRIRYLDLDAGWLDRRLDDSVYGGLALQF